MEGSRKRARRLLAVTATVAAFAALAVASTGSAAKSPEPAGGEISSDFTPLSVSTEEVSVIVEVAGKPTALVEAAKGRDLSNAEEAQVKAGLDRVQRPVEAAVERLGGEVLAEYQDALNGVRVDIARNKLDEVAQIANVVDVHSVAIYDRPNNLNGVPLIGAPSVWQGLGGTPFRGEGMKIAVLDSGVDFTHANFAGPGTPAAFAAADAADTVAPNPMMFGPAAPKVKGGLDLVGDNYDASSTDPAKTTPVPDPNPLDCTTGNVDGHGSHVSGTATGFGVLSNGNTFTGPYNANTLTSNTFRIGPGVAPLADLYAVRLFGCSGSTNVTVDAIEWAVDNDMDVINMSLGSNYGASDDASAEASTNAARAGTIVVASAGNAGPAQYITGSPATGTGAISVAANDPVANLPGALMDVATGADIQAINANGFTPLPAGALEIKVLKNADGTVKRGCNHPDAPDDLRDPADDAAVNDYVDVAGKVVVVQRGTCARVARAIYGQKEGAAAVVMINNSTVLPPFEGPITENADTGAPFNVTIPFLGVRGLVTTSGTDGFRLAALDGTMTTLTGNNLPNTNFKGFASFTSGGPRLADSHLKPNVTAPGQSILSTNMATGAQGSIKSGTSMAAPHTTGAAALVRQAHPSWSVQNIKAAIENTSSPADAGSSLTPFRISRGGSGLIQPLNAIKTNAVATGTQGTGAVSFGFDESTGNFSDSGEIEVENLGTSNVTFNVAAVMPQGSPHSILLEDSSVTVRPGRDQDVDFRLVVPVGTVGSTFNPATGAAAFREVAGFIELTPASPGMNNGVALRVPYYFVPRADSNLRTDVDDRRLTPSQPSSAVEVTNTNGAITGDADFYAWGLEDRSEPKVLYNDLRAVGVQSFANPPAPPAPPDPTRRLLVFAVNYHERSSSQSITEIDILIDVNQDGTDDYALVGADLGLLTGAGFNGTYVTAVFPINTTGDCVPDAPGAPPSVDPCPGTLAFNATAPTDSSTVLLPIRNTNFSVAALPNHPRMTQATNPRFTYHAESFAFRAGEDDVGTGTAEFNTWNPSLTNAGDFETLTVPPGGTATTTVDINAAEWAQTPQKGLMVVNFDDRSGNSEADLTSIRFGPGGGG
jgi:minor extracellular serine protease Vpr